MKRKLLIIFIILTIVIVYSITCDYNNLLEPFYNIIYEAVPDDMSIDNLSDIEYDTIQDNILANNFEPVSDNILLNTLFSKDSNDYHIIKLRLNLYNQNEPYLLSLEAFNNKFNSNIKGLSNRIAAVGIDTSVEPKFFIYVDNPSNSNYLGITIDYWMKNIHNSLNKQKYFFILCFNDGYKFDRDNIIENSVENMIFLSYPPIKYQLDTVFTYSKRIDDTKSICIPDPYFCNYKQHSKQLKEIRDNYVRWSDKINTCIWRGNINNSFNINFIDTKNKDNLNPRQYFFQLYKNNKIKNCNYSSKFTTISEQIKYKYILDIDGWSNTWDATVWKLYSGSILLKVKSLWKQWYYDELVEWEHYVPINNDFSDLNEKIEWCINNDDKCKQIAINSNNFVDTKLNNAYVKKKICETVNKYFTKSNNE